MGEVMGRSPLTRWGVGLARRGRECSIDLGRAGLTFRTCATCESFKYRLNRCRESPESNGTST